MAKDDAFGKVVDNAVKIGSTLIQSGKKSSAFRLTSDQVFQFPMIMDADIDDDEKFPIIKALEKNYAEIIMIAITNEGSVDKDKYKSINDFLHKFHTNSDKGFDIDYTGSTVTEAVATEGTGMVDNYTLKAMWDNVEEGLNTTPINDMYLPFKTTEAKISRALESARIATEAAGNPGQFFFYPIAMKDKQGKAFRDKYGNTIMKTSPSGVEYGAIPATADNIDALTADLGKPMTEREWNILQARKDPNYHPADIKTEAQMVKDDKFNALTPTILKLTISNTKKDVGTWMQNLIIGIRAMPRFIPQSMMVTNMIDAFQDRGIFKWIKWTKGEIKWSEIFLGWDTAKKNADTKSSSRWLRLLRKRAKKNNFMRWFGKKLNPNATVIITEADAQMISERGFVDPHDAKNAAMLMDKYFLLAFGIYDTESKMLNIMYDGEGGFSTYSMRSMIADSKKDLNLLAMNKY